MNDFLKNKYNLHNAPEVEQAAKRTQIQEGESIPQDPQSRIQNYLDRFNSILEREDPQNRERGIEAIKRLLHSKFVIKQKDIPNSYYELQRRIAREEGHGNIQITQEQKDELAEIVIHDQQSTLDLWIDYLSSPDAPYPDWLKYYALRSILNIGEYDKEKKQFTKRSKRTTKPFPDLNREALAYVLDLLEKKYSPKKIDLSSLDQIDRQELERLLKLENFGDLYAFAIEKVTPISFDKLQTTKGRWVKYNQGEDHMPLVQSLQGYGTGWCTAGESTAQKQLEGGDFYVYYSEDEQHNPIIPRVAIRMSGSSIGEVRGIAHQQNLDPYITDIVQEKLKEFPDGSQYEKKNRDMKLLTLIEKKTEKGQPLSKQELEFLYEVNSPIQGFGYQKDPRIEEIRDKRNKDDDMLVIFECTKEQIAKNKDEIKEDTKAYIGSLFPGIFTILQKHNIEHIYTSFPEGRIRREEIIIGGKTEEQLEKEMEQQGMRMYDSTRDIMRKMEIQINPESLSLIRLSVRDLGFTQNPTTDQLYQRATELGLDLCPAEVGPHYRLSHKDQPMGDWVHIAMQPIASRDGSLSVFDVESSDSGLWLRSGWASPGSRWRLVRGFVFCFRK